MNTTNNSLEYISHLIMLGINTDLAMSMAEQYNSTGTGHPNAFELHDHASDAVLGFAYWEDTVEGHDYWSEYHDIL